MDRPFLDGDERGGDEEVEPVHRRNWHVVTVSILVVVVVLGAVFYEAASHYQPLSQSLGGGYISEVLTSKGAPAQFTRVGQTVVDIEPSGSFRVEVVFSLNNLQRFPVTIERVSPPPIPSGSSDVHVFFDSKGNAEGVYGVKGGPIFTPTTLASKGQLELVIHWNQECVPSSADDNDETYSELPVEFSFLGFHHTVNVPIQSLTIGPRATC